MKGYHVERRFGWDTHGLPIEHEIDKKLGISGKDAVMKFGLAKYNEECRAIVMRFSTEWRQTIDRLGRWVDFDNDYKASFSDTHSTDYVSYITDNGRHIYGIRMVGLQADL
jgi:isoleucyl-tRNA synthetase